MASKSPHPDDDPIAVRRAPVPDPGPAQAIQRGQGGAQPHPSRPCSQATIRVLIADDHPVVRRGLKQIVSEQTDMTVVGEAQNGREVLALVRKQPCEVVLTDISMPGRSGLEVLKDLKQAHPKLPVLMLSMHPEDQYGVRALRLGASGYMIKGSAPEELVKAIRTVVAGGRYVSPALAEKLALDLGATSGPPLHETLSECEYQILCMLASGRSVKEIADEQSASVSSIRAYRLRIRDKMGVKNTADLICYAVRNRLVNIPDLNEASHRLSSQADCRGTNAFPQRVSDRPRSTSTPQPPYPRN